MGQPNKITEEAGLGEHEWNLNLFWKKKKLDSIDDGNLEVTTNGIIVT